MTAFGQERTAEEARNRRRAPTCSSPAQSAEYRFQEQLGETRKPKSRSYDPSVAESQWLEISDRELNPYGLVVPQLGKLLMLGPSRSWRLSHQASTANAKSMLITIAAASMAMRFQGMS